MTAFSYLSMDASPKVYKKNKEMELNAWQHKNWKFQTLKNN